MKTRPLLRGFFIAVLVVAAAWCDAAAAQARLDDVKVSTDPPFTVSFAVSDAFNDDLVEAIRSGIPTTFTYVAELHRLNTLWFDEPVQSWTFRHTVKYDTLKEEYEVTLGEKPGEEPGSKVRTRDFDEMKRLMATVDDVALRPEHKLEEGASYELRLMARLNAVDLPGILDYIFFFVKFWDVETDWYVHGFVYGGKEQGGAGAGGRR
ncbi:MAG TPA: DUF4390 domain-containing protein [Deltaproteobacteria bacterium]|nr:DUF4390 domain-containing protein [Deltaproteobacteria bacterium]